MNASLGLVDLVKGVDHDLGLLGQVADAAAKREQIVRANTLLFKSQGDTSAR